MLTENLSPLTQHIFFTILALVLVYIIARALRRVINTKVKDLKKKHQYRKTVYYVGFGIFCAACLEIWTTSLPSITTILSFTGAGLALALHEVVLCVAGFFVINIKKLYEVGDRIEARGIKGDVIDINTLHTVMIEVGNWVDADQSTGRIVSVPNSAVVRDGVYNYTREFTFIWNEIPILVTFESDWEKARDIVLSVAQENAEENKDRMNKLISKMSDKYMVHYKRLTPYVYVSIKDSGVLLTLRYLTEAKKRRGSVDELSQLILQGFAEEAKIDLAYPTTRFFQPSSPS